MKRLVLLLFLMGLQGQARPRAEGDLHQPMIMPNGVSVASDFPHITVSTRNDPADGYLYPEQLAG